MPQDYRELAENRLCAYAKSGKLLRDAQGRPLLECLCGKVIRGDFDPTRPFSTPKGSFWTNSLTELLASTSEEDLELINPRYRCMGYESLALILLTSDEGTVGLLKLNDQRKGRFTLPIKAKAQRLKIG